MSDMNLRSPWEIYCKRVEALFDNDPDVITLYDAAEVKLSLLVNGDDKAQAIESLLPPSRQFGNVTLDIEVIPSNDQPTESDVFRRAFSGNAAFVDVVDGYGPVGDVSYALFLPEVAQIPEDDISEFGGMTTITYADLAEYVLDGTSVRISSSLIDD